MPSSDTYHALKSLFRKKRTYLVLGGYVSITILLFLLLIKRSPLVLVAKDHVHHYDTYDDTIDEGNSKVYQVTETERGLKVDYELDGSFSNPYVGIVFFFVKPTDITGYDRLHLAIEAEGPDNVQLFLTTKDRNVKDTTHRLARRHSLYSLVFEKDRNTYDIPVNEFKTPGWWYEALGQAVNDFGPIEMERMMGMAISTGYSPVIGKPQSLVIRSFYFYKDYQPFFFVCVLIGSLLFLMLFVSEYVALRRSGRIMEVVYKPLENTEKEETGFLAYIHHHYEKADMSLKEVAKASGVSERTISKTIAEQFRCNFKTYINSIRVEEAKRLLTTSKLNISEIAYKVGFNSPSTFTKVFKKTTGKSPSDYASKVL